MIQVTRLDGALVYINEANIQWIEKLPDTSITFLSGARILVRDTPEEIAQRVNQLHARPAKPVSDSGSTSASVREASNS
ncbi:MAG: flagellar protein FlbD [Betaproteobacteria bacterium]|nr:flagellar protein FlbD [Betaproteobacteria bacterium]